MAFMNLDEYFVTESSLGSVIYTAGCYVLVVEVAGVNRFLRLKDSAGVFSSLRLCNGEWTFPYSCEWCSWRKINSGSFYSIRFIFFMFVCLLGKLELGGCVAGGILRYQWNIYIDGLWQILMGYMISQALENMLREIVICAVSHLMIIYQVNGN